MKKLADLEELNTGFFFEESINGVTVTLAAERGVLEEGTWASIIEVDADTGEVLDEGWSENGLVKVRFSGERIARQLEEADAVTVSHVGENGERKEVTNMVEEDEEIVFEAEHFSVYEVCFLQARTGSPSTVYVRGESEVPKESCSCGENPENEHDSLACAIETVKDNGTVVITESKTLRETIGISGKTLSIRGEAANDYLKSENAAFRLSQGARLNIAQDVFQEETKGKIELVNGEGDSENITTVELPEDYKEVALGDSSGITMSAEIKNNIEAAYEDIDSDFKIISSTPIMLINASEIWYELSLDSDLITDKDNLYAACIPLAKEDGTESDKLDESQSILLLSAIEDDSKVRLQTTETDRQTTYAVILVQTSNAATLSFDSPLINYAGGTISEQFKDQADQEKPPILNTWGIPPFTWKTSEGETASFDQAQRFPLDIELRIEGSGYLDTNTSRVREVRVVYELPEDIHIPPVVTVGGQEKLIAFGNAAAEATVTFRPVTKTGEEQEEIVTKIGTGLSEDTSKVQAVKTGEIVFSTTTTPSEPFDDDSAYLLFDDLISAENGAKAAIINKLKMQDQTLLDPSYEYEMKFIDFIAYDYGNLQLNIDKDISAANSTLDIYWPYPDSFPKKNRDEGNAQLYYTGDLTRDYNSPQEIIDKINQRRINVNPGTVAIKPKSRLR